MLDALTTTEEVVQALNAALEQDFNERKVEVLDPYRRSDKKAIINLSEKEPDFLLEMSHDCKKEDRSQHCYRCNQNGPKKKECNNESKCLYC